MKAMMAPATSDLLPRRRYRSVRELRWGESARVETPRGDVIVRGIEVKHWGARIRRDRGERHRCGHQGSFQLMRHRVSPLSWAPRCISRLGPNLETNYRIVPTAPLGAEPELLWFVGGGV